MARKKPDYRKEAERVSAALTETKIEPGMLHGSVKLTKKGCPHVAAGALFLVRSPEGWSKCESSGSIPELFAKLKR